MHGNALIIAVELKIFTFHSGLVSLIIRGLDSLLLYIVKQWVHRCGSGKCAINPIWKMDHDYSHLPNSQHTPNKGLGGPIAKKQ